MKHKAVYAEGKRDIAKNIFETACNDGKRAFYPKIQRGKATGFGVKEAFEDSANLVANADLVISYGGTIAREAALQGVPSIAISDMAKTYVNTYLAQKGFPLFITTERQTCLLAQRSILENGST